MYTRLKFVLTFFKPNYFFGYIRIALFKMKYPPRMFF